MRKIRNLRRQIYWTSDGAPYASVSDRRKRTGRQIYFQQDGCPAEFIEITIRPTNWGQIIIV